MENFSGLKWKYIGDEFSSINSAGDIVACITNIPNRHVYVSSIKGNDPLNFNWYRIINGEAWGNSISINAELQRIYIIGGKRYPYYTNIDTNNINKTLIKNLSWKFIGGKLDDIDTENLLTIGKNRLKNVYIRNTILSTAWSKMKGQLDNVTVNWDKKKLFGTNSKQILMMDIPMRDQDSIVYNELLRKEWEVINGNLDKIDSSGDYLVGLNDGIPYIKLIDNLEGEWTRLKGTNLVDISVNSEKKILYAVNTSNEAFAMKLTETTKEDADEIEKKLMLNTSKEEIYNLHYQYLGLELEDIVMDGEMVDKFETDLKLFDKEVNGESVIYRNIPIITPYDIQVTNNLRDLNDGQSLIFEYPFLVASGQYVESSYIAHDRGSGCNRNFYVSQHTLNINNSAGYKLNKYFRTVGDEINRRSNSYKFLFALKDPRFAQPLKLLQHNSGYNTYHRAKLHFSSITGDNNERFFDNISTINTNQWLFKHLENLYKFPMERKYNSYIYANNFIKRSWLHERYLMPLSSIHSFFLYSRQRLDNSKGYNFGACDGPLNSTYALYSTMSGNIAENTAYVGKGSNLKSITLFSLNMIVDYLLGTNWSRMPEQNDLNYNKYDNDTFKQYLNKIFCETNNLNGIPNYFINDRCKLSAHIDQDINKPYTNDYKTFITDYCSIGDNYLGQECFNLCKNPNNNELQTMCDNIYGKKCSEVIQTAITIIPATETQPEKKYVFYSNKQFADKNNLSLAKRRCACYFTVDDIPEYSDISNGGLLDQTLKNRMGCLSTFCANDEEAYHNIYKRNEQCDLCISNTQITSEGYGSIDASNINQVQSCNSTSTAQNPSSPEPLPEPSPEPSPETPSTGSSTSQNELNLGTQQETTTFTETISNFFYGDDDEDGDQKIKEKKSLSTSDIAVIIIIIVVIIVVVVVVSRM